MDKPLKDWTLEELQQYCKKMNLKTCNYHCKLREFCNKYVAEYKSSHWENYDGWNKTP